MVQGTMFLFLFTWNSYTAHHIFYAFFVKMILTSVLAICCTFSSSFLMSSAYFWVVCLKNSFMWRTSSSATASFLPRSSSYGCLLGVLFADSYWTTRTCINNFWSNCELGCSPMTLTWQGVTLVLRMWGSSSHPLWLCRTCCALSSFSLIRAWSCKICCFCLKQRIPPA